MNGIYPLRGIVKHYDWGGDLFIPRLLAISNPDRQPFAEYWMGIHPMGTSSILQNDHWVALTEQVSSFSFLLKVLDVKNMLSIQVHPDLAGAEDGFERENAMGIPVDAPHRNYRDRNHKPEMMVALSDFWLLHGFKPVEEMVDILSHIDHLNEFLPPFNEKGYKGLYHHIMQLNPEEVQDRLVPLKEYLNARPALNKEDEDFWVASALNAAPDAVRDAGIFSIYLFNLVHLKKGEGIFQGAGLPHAYLEGQNVEIMANSDNVLRGGLTSKNIDVPELLRHVKCEASFPHVIPFAGHGAEPLYHSPVPDFSLQVLELKSSSQKEWLEERGGILLITEGELLANGLHLGPGSPAALIKPGTKLRLEVIENSMVFLASGR